MSARWSVLVRDLAGGGPVESVEPGVVHRTASVGKVFLLYEVARRIEAGELDPGLVLERTEEDAIADSGLWHHLSTGALRVDDLAALVGSFSDNLATNVLLRHVGMHSVHAVGASLGLTHTALHDKVRADRGPGDPPALSTGTATELCELMAELARGERLDRAAAARVRAWLALDTDLSMVASAFGLDPLCHFEEDRGVLLWNKTGTNSGVRADVGVVQGPAGGVAYAVLASWDEGPDPRDEVLGAMRAVGERIRARVTAG